MAPMTNLDSKVIEKIIFQPLTLIKIFSQMWTASYRQKFVHYIHSILDVLI